MQAVTNWQDDLTTIRPESAVNGPFSISRNPRSGPHISPVSESANTMGISTVYWVMPTLRSLTTGNIDRRMFAVVKVGIVTTGLAGTAGRRRSVVERYVPVSKRNAFNDVFGIP